MNKKIRLLILAGTPGLFGNNNPYNGGGWIASLEKELLERHSEELELGLAWPTDRSFADVVDGVKYYGILKESKIFIHAQSKERNYCSAISKVIEDYNPDVILCFGTENGLALVDTFTDIPVLIHLQGILNAVFETWMPEGLTWRKFIRKYPSQLIAYLSLKVMLRREIKAMKACKYYLGRTDWDRHISSIVSPKAKYYYCSEMLRPVIYESKKTWNPQHHDAIKIVSVISGSPYKGGDVILRAASVLKTYAAVEFKWEVYGVSQKNMILWEKLTGIKSEDVSVDVRGVIDANGLVDTLTSADVCVHPSYIENSPNTVCEMQVLGCPVIATDVGGTSTLIKDGENGLLIPANHPWTMAAQILRLFTDKETAMRLGENARKTALERHDPEKIVNDLMDAIKETINDRKCNDQKFNK